MEFPTSSEDANSCDSFDLHSFAFAWHLKPLKSCELGSLRRFQFYDHALEMILSAEAQQEQGSANRLSLHCLEGDRCPSPWFFRSLRVT